MRAVICGCRSRPAFGPASARPTGDLRCRVVQTPRPHRYAFGDTATASQRLGVLASVFVPTSTALLRSLRGGSGSGTPPALVLDLGCGPGHTTAMLAEAFPSAL